MCGIAGFAGRFEPELLDRMNAIQSHRGPDDAATAFLPNEAIGLAHRRLSIIDLSPAGRQPMWSADRSAAIVFNGEIFNYRELRAELAASGAVFASHSDTEVLLHLYRRDGVRLLDRLNGMFAFALWDARERVLFLARDGVGVKPLYWAETPKGFLFASEMKTLLLEPSVGRELDPLGVQEHLSFLWCTAPRTVLRAVRKLEPGCAMTVRAGRVERGWRFYDLPYGTGSAIASADEAALRVREAVDTAVERQMVADVPVGAFLSGGLDSSAVVAAARGRTSGYKLPCFTIAFRDEAYRREGFADDLAYARKVASDLDVDLHVVEVGEEMADHLDAMIWHLDEPTADPAPLNVLYISALARRNGIKVLLSGAGGDDIFSGYRRHLAIRRERFWGWLPPSLRGVAAAAARLAPASGPAGRRIRRAFARAGEDADRRLAGYFVWPEPGLARSLHGPLLRDALAGTDEAGPLLESLRRLPAGLDPLDRMLYLDAKHFLADHNLNYGDKMAMAVGVETRVPLLDPDLVALATRIPARFKQRGATGKWIFKKAMEPVLPREVIYRPKSGFGAPLRTWLKGRLRPWVDDLLSPRSLERRGLFDPAGVRVLLEADRAGRVDGAYTIFSLICLEAWCRLFLDGAPRPALPVSVDPAPLP